MTVAFDLKISQRPSKFFRGNKKTKIQKSSFVFALTNEVIVDPMEEN